MDYAHAPKVKQDEPLSDILKQTPGVVAGINGDFFDIGDSGAPLGLGRARGEGLLHGIDYGWNNAFWIDRKDNKPHIDLLHPQAWVVGHPEITISNLNSPQVKPNGIGIYTPRFGSAIGNRWVDGFTRYARVVHVRNGRVMTNTTSFPTGAFEGTYIVARGPEQRRQVRALKVGSKLQVGWRLPEGPAFAITGQSILLKDGQILATDDRELHPRTMVGIDRDGGQIIWVVVDGRRESTTGYTMVQEARLMKQLGAEDALNLDGGGSSIMLARQADGSLAVLNSPSDGHPRAVANGLEVTYDPPAS